MPLEEMLTALEGSAIAHAISKSNHLVAASLQVVHVVGFVALLAALLLLSLRLLNWSFADHPRQDVVKDASRLLYIGLALVTGSGALMFAATPRLYFYKPVFGLKMALFIAALALQFMVLRKLAGRDAVRLRTVRAIVGLSVLAWFSIGFAGRMIGFT